MSKEIYNAFETAQVQFDAVAEKIELDEATRELLRQPMREYHFSIPVKMDDGSVKIFRDTGSSTMTPGVRLRVVYAFIRWRPSIQSEPCPCG